MNNFSLVVAYNYAVFDNSHQITSCKLYKDQSMVDRTSLLVPFLLQEYGAIPIRLSDVVYHEFSDPNFLSVVFDILVHKCICCCEF